MLERQLAQRLPGSAPPRRLVVVTGARQVGKTTLARYLYEQNLRYVNLDSPGERSRLAGIPAEGWAASVGPAVLDEVQKAPALLDKVKWSYDEGALDFTVLLGSSRLFLLERVRESLAGRVFLYDLWPLTVSELMPWFDGPPVRRPFLLRILDSLGRWPAAFEDAAPVLAGKPAGTAQAAMKHLLDWGGLPPLLEYPASDRMAWLDAYHATYLERDLRDIARLRDLDTFSICHRLAALRAGRILSFSDLARDAAIPVTTVRRYLRYLDLSYQTLLLPAWSGNPSVRLVKAPRLIWLDAGVQRSLSGQFEGLTGEQYESTIVAQCHITLSNHGSRARLSYLRTSGGLEVDLLIEVPAGILAIEFKARDRVDRGAARGIERARRILGDRLRGGLVVYRGTEVELLSAGVFAVPDWVLLGA